MSVLGDTRLYAASIAFVSGVYSIATALTDNAGMMPMSATVMLLIGAVVLIHGVILVTPLAWRLGRASGPLMLLWAAIMLANQVLAGTMSASGMESSWDAGMVAVALLMLASGGIMSRRRDSM